MDRDTLEQLTEILTAQCSVLRALVAVAERQQQALLQRDQAGVEATAKEQEELVVELNRCEAERLALLSGGADDASSGAFGNADGVAASGAGEAATATLQQIVEAAPEAFRSTLAELREEARSLVERLTTLNETNAQLLRQELALIDLYMSVLSPDAGVEMYEDPARGKRPAGGASVAFDARA